ncbi:nucleotide sugar dehydrogenase [Candidatus Bathyarchaeota archaeon]|nr:nucleotide sugar dehydrogenase [Candidatus Bathyarchaeota archaeon]
MRTHLDTVAVYGLGYVGLALCSVWLRAGYRVIGVDIQEAKVKSLSNGQPTHAEPEVRREIAVGTSSGCFEATTNGVYASKNSYIKVVSVPVDLDEGNNPQLGSLTQAVKGLGHGLERGDVVILESSVPLGTTMNIVGPQLEQASGLEVEDDFYLAYSPERVYVGRAVKDIEERYPKIVGGVGPRSAKVVGELYAKIAKKGVMMVSSPTVAEFGKLAEGVYRDVNIALANELAILSSNAGIDFDEMAAVVNSQPYCHLHRPGTGVGGACIPVYPRFLMSTASDLLVDLDLTNTARRINSFMPEYVARLAAQLSYRLDLENPKVVILGLAFRGGIDDTRLSPTYDLVNALIKSGLDNLVISDPYVANDSFLEDLGFLLTPDLGRSLSGADLAIVATDHPEYRCLDLRGFKSMMHREKIGVVDGRHLVEDWKDPPRGTIYAAIGRPTRSNL